MLPCILLMKDIAIFTDHLLPCITMQALHSVTLIGRVSLACCQKYTSMVKLMLNYFQFTQTYTAIHIYCSVKSMINWLQHFVSNLDDYKPPNHVPPPWVGLKSGQPPPPTIEYTLAS